MSPSLGSPKPSGRTAPRRTPTRCRSTTSRPRTARAVSKYCYVVRRMGITALHDHAHLLAFSIGAGGDPNILYYHSYWRLPAGMALRIRVRPPPCRYWNFQLNSASRRASNPRAATPRHAAPRRATPRHAAPRRAAIRALVALERGLTPLCTPLTQTTGWRASTTATSPYTPTAASREPTRPTAKVWP